MIQFSNISQLTAGCLKHYIGRVDSVGNIFFSHFMGYISLAALTLTLLRFTSDFIFKFSRILTVVILGNT